jgi:hypothetical protein
VSERESERRREGERERGREGESERVREGERERGREGERDRGTEGERFPLSLSASTPCSAKAPARLPMIGGCVGE